MQCERSKVSAIHCTALYAKPCEINVLVSDHILLGDPFTLALKLARTSVVSMGGLTSIYPSILHFDFMISNGDDLKTCTQSTV